MTMLASGSHSLGSINPWSSNDTLLGIRLGDPQSGLVLARRQGLLPHHVLESSHHQEQVPGMNSAMRRATMRKAAESDTTDTRMANSSSIKMMKLLQEISQTSEELNQIELEVHKCLLDREMADLTHVAVLESKLQRVNLLLNHLTEVITGKDHLLSRLQSRATENSLKIEAPFQKHASEVLSSVGPMLSELPSHCNRLQWAKSLDIQRTSVEEKSAKGVESLLQCKAAYGQCQQLHEAQSKLNVSG